MKMIEPWVKDLPQVVVMPETDTYDLMKGCSIAIASSGTSPLELALHEKPTVVTYGGTFFDRLVVKYYSKWSFPYYCLVNVVANRSVFAELIYKDCSSEKIYEEMKRVYLSDERKRCCVAQCKRMKDMIIHRPDTLTYQYASRHVAHLLMAML
jgi:lipid-A-disaccharide synthase